MKRCTVCDTSDLNSFSQEIGVLGPPLYWSKEETGEDICGHCCDAIHETISDFHLEDTMKEEEQCR